MAWSHTDTGFIFVFILFLMSSYQNDYRVHPTSSFSLQLSNSTSPYGLNQNLWFWNIKNSIPFHNHEKHRLRFGFLYLVRAWSSISSLTIQYRLPPLAINKQPQGNCTAMMKIIKWSVCSILIAKQKKKKTYILPTGESNFQRSKSPLRIGLGSVLRQYNAY